VREREREEKCVNKCMLYQFLGVREGG